jgi:hypothetical protein
MQLNPCDNVHLKSHTYRQCLPPFSPKTTVCALPTYRWWLADRDGAGWEMATMCTNSAAALKKVFLIYHAVPYILATRITHACSRSAENNLTMLVCAFSANYQACLLLRSISQTIVVPSYNPSSLFTKNNCQCLTDIPVVARRQGRGRMRNDNE